MYSSLGPCDYGVNEYLCLFAGTIFLELRIPGCVDVDEPDGCAYACVDKPLAVLEPDRIRTIAPSLNSRANRRQYDNKLG